MVIKYLTISQHDDSYTTLDKILKFEDFFEFFKNNNLKNILPKLIPKAHSVIHVIPFASI
jgi:hypothetical protein